jgi:hypothetical protein
VLQQHVAGGEDPETAAGQEGTNPALGEVHAVARDIEVIPAIAADPGLEARQVGHADEQPTGWSQPRADRREG